MGGGWGRGIVHASCWEKQVFQRNTRKKKMMIWRSAKTGGDGSVAAGSTWIAAALLLMGECK